MIEVIRNDSGDIIAVCEWLLFNERGIIDDRGDICFIAELEINKSCRGNGVLRQILKGIESKAMTAKRVFYYRENKYPGREVKILPIEMCRKRIGG